ncbi:MAG: GNAT family N-acetyltransferase [Kofleriaceae bacterium]
MATIRTLRDDEREWANARYREIRFSESGRDCLGFVAELAEPARDAAIDRAIYAAIDPAIDPAIDARLDPRVGLGRLVELEPGVFELGGIWTSDRARNRGIARAMVTTLLAHAPRVRLWCVPFAHLVPFYEQFGFRAAPRPWPARVEAKVADCEAHRLPTVVVLARDA